MGFHGNVLMFCRNPRKGCLLEASLNQQDLTTNPSVKTIQFATVKCRPKIFLSDEFCAILALNVFWIPSSGSRMVGSRSVNFKQVSLWQYVTPLLRLYYTFHGGHLHIYICLDLIAGMKCDLLSLVECDHYEDGSIPG